MLNINRKEIYRYLGIRRGDPDDETKRKVEECIGELLQVITPRMVYRVFPLSFPEDGSIDFTCFRVRSQSLLKNLKGCEKIILFAATIGERVDLLLRRYNKLEVSRAVVMQAASAATIEAYCNQINQEMKEKAAQEGYFLRPRFSPGYGDFPLETQRLISDVLKMEKTCGITLTDSLLMMPSKSVTAVIGMGRKEERHTPDKCSLCGMGENCQYRSERREAGTGIDT